MNYWGIAYSYGPNINFPSVDADTSRKALDALKKADAASGANPLERELIESQKLRFAPEGPKDRRQLDAAYSKELRTLWKKNPKDPDVGAFFAEALIDEQPWNQWTPAGEPNPGTLEAVETLEAVLKLNSKHPMGLHMMIHSLEASPNPERALKAADSLFNRFPELGHMQHMPCHIYARTGRWEKSIRANIDALKKEDSYLISRGMDPKKSPKIDHDGEALAFAAGMRGQSKLALDAVTIQGFTMKELETEYADLDGDLAMPLEVQQQFGKWDQILATPSFGSKLPVSETMRFGARCVALAATGHLDEAKIDRDNFEKTLLLVPADKSDGLNLVKDVLEVERHLVKGEILVRESGNEDSGLIELRKAVANEDALHYAEPPDWLMPTRHSLGAALLLLGHFDEAESVFRENLRRCPHDGWATLGLSKALLGLGKKSEASRFLAEFKKLWKDADTQISTSCMCLEVRKGS
jgi:tetratricopeptide (TPR) repeat protein